MDWLLGVDIGGSHISCVPVNPSAKRMELDKLQRLEINANGTFHEITEGWLSLLKRFQINAYSGIGIAMPAPFDYDAGVSYLKTQGKFTSLYGRNLKKILAEGLNLNPGQISFANDAAAFLQGEVDFGGLDKKTKFMGITLGTGLGSAFKSGTLAQDAELWSSPFKDGIAEDYLGTQWFENWALSSHGLKLKGVKTLLEVKDKAIVNEAFYLFGRNLGEFLVPHLVNKASEMLIIGGNVAKAEEAFLPYTRGILKNSGIETCIQISKLGELAAAYGAVCFHMAKRSK